MVSLDDDTFKSMSGDCPLSPSVQGLEAAVKMLAEKVESVRVDQRELVRLLMFAIIAIAIGKEAVGLGREFIDRTRPAVAESRAIEPQKKTDSDASRN